MLIISSLTIIFLTGLVLGYYLQVLLFKHHVKHLLDELTTDSEDVPNGKAAD